MRNAAAAIGALLALIGLVWIGQGLGYVKGSFMTGQIMWFWIGLGCLIGGAALILVPRLLIGRLATPKRK